MKVSNNLTIELTREEATELARVLDPDTCNTEAIEYRLKEELYDKLGLKSWDFW
jgi:hypothetical protein